jgi:two-component system, NtrC family, response regulator AtoC
MSSLPRPSDTAEDPRGRMGRARDALARVIGESPQIRAVRDQVGRLLDPVRGLGRLPPILILGETGTGKGLLARAIHEASARAHAPFVAVNCAAIPESLLEGELFGFERGAFTGAQQAKPGLLQTAHRGTVFLDEIGALPIGLQAKLLTVLEERVVRRLGSLHSEALDLWIVAATSEPIPEAVRERRIREDLYHRLAAITLTLPPLRERGADLLRLADHFLDQACHDYAIPSKRLSPDARTALLGHAWPGNIRELANVMTRAAILTEESVISPGALGLPGGPPEPVPPPVLRGSAAPFRDRLDDFERTQLLAALESAAWNTSRAASALGIARNTLRYRINKLGLRPAAGARAPTAATGLLPAGPAGSNAQSVTPLRPGRTS